jgi:hypothetical protein
MDQKRKFKVPVVFHYRGEQHRVVFEQYNLDDEEETNAEFAKKFRELIQKRYPEVTDIPDFDTYPFVLCSDFGEINEPLSAFPDEKARPKKENNLYCISSKKLSSKVTV